MITLSSRETADLIGVEITTLATWRSAGKGPKYQKFNGRIRYCRDVVLAWIRDNTVHVEPSSWFDC